MFFLSVPQSQWSCLMLASSRKAPGPSHLGCSSVSHSRHVHLTNMERGIRELIGLRGSSSHLAGHHARSHRGTWAQRKIICAWTQPALLGWTVLMEAVGRKRRRGGNHNVKTSQDPWTPCCSLSSIVDTTCGEG